MNRQVFTLALFGLLAVRLVAQGAVLRNERCRVDLAPDGAAVVIVPGMKPQTFQPEFTVLWSETDPGCARNPSHPNHPAAPRVALRWRQSSETVESLNAWVGSAEFSRATGMNGVVSEKGKAREWEYRDKDGKTKVRVNGTNALDTTRPFAVGHRVDFRAQRGVAESGRIRWEFAPREEFDFAAELTLPEGGAGPVLAFTLKPRREAFYSVAYVGAPAAPLAQTRYVPQECDARGHKQFGFVMSEADLHLPRAHVATADGNVALVAEAGECRFRLPTFADSRFGFMLADEGGALRPVLLAPLLGGAESHMGGGVPWRFRMHLVVQAGDWKETYAHIARELAGFRDLRDNSGPGSLNATLEHVMDFLADRHGGNRALWDAQQKYYDYFTDKTGVFKPFSAAYGLSAAIVTDDEEFYRTRARPALEFALSRKTLIFAPYDAANNKQANSAGRTVGGPVPGYAQLLGLHELLQRRSPVLADLAEAKGPAKKSVADALAQWQLTGDGAALEQAKGAARTPGAVIGEEELFDLVDLAATTRDPGDIAAAREAAYQNAAKLNLYPAPPDQLVTVDRGGVAPVHPHSLGRHKNIWGFPPPLPVRVPEQTVPAWRISRLGLPGIAYPIEYWMNTQGATMRTAGLAGDSLLRDIARSGMVGRFGNYPGDNRSLDSLIPESASAVEAPPWNWNFATVNPGHAWDFAAQVLDFLVSDAFERSGGAIDFPAMSAAGSSFRVRLYGAKAGRFYDDENVHLWLPRGLVTSDNQQLDWLAGHGNGRLYLAVWNQSAEEQHAVLKLDPARAKCTGGEARRWYNNKPSEAVRVREQQLEIRLPPRGIVALAMAAEVKPGLQAKLYHGPALEEPTHARIDAPFGRVRAMLLSAGRGLSSAYVYTEALPENVIAARLHWRQGDGPWQRIADDIYPYEFSPELRDEAGAFQCVLEVKNARREVQRSPLITLGSSDRTDLPEAMPFPELKPSEMRPPSAEISEEFVAYLQQAGNGANFGLRADGRFYPYSTPLGRRIAWRQPVWDLAHFAEGCSREEAQRHLRSDLARALEELKRLLAARSPAVSYKKLKARQQEMLLDFAWTEGAAALKAAYVEAVLSEDWDRIAKESSYIRYAGHAPDHARNKAFASRFGF